MRKEKEKVRYLPPCERPYLRHRGYKRQLAELFMLWMLLGRNDGCLDKLYWGCIRKVATIGLGPVTPEDQPCMRSVLGPSREEPKSIAPSPDSQRCPSR